MTPDQIRKRVAVYDGILADWDKTLQDYDDATLRLDMNELRAVRDLLEGQWCKKARIEAKAKRAKAARRKAKESW